MRKMVLHRNTLIDWKICVRFSNESLSSSLKAWKAPFYDCFLLTCRRDNFLSTIRQVDSFSMNVIARIGNRRHWRRWQRIHRTRQLFLRRRPSAESFDGHSASVAVGIHQLPDISGSFNGNPLFYHRPVAFSDLLGKGTAEKNADKALRKGGTLTYSVVGPVSSNSRNHQPRTENLNNLIKVAAVLTCSINLSARQL